MLHINSEASHNDEGWFYIDIDPTKLTEPTIRLWMDENYPYGEAFLKNDAIIANPDFVDPTQEELNELRKNLKLINHQYKRLENFSYKVSKLYSNKFYFFLFKKLVELDSRIYKLQTRLEEKARKLGYNSFLSALGDEFSDGELRYCINLTKTKTDQPQYIRVNRIYFYNEEKYIKFKKDFDLS